MILSTILGTRVVAVIGAAIVAGGSLAGVGVAANAAAPGDGLYGLDCAMERIGLGDGGVQERVQEAAKMVKRGEVDKGLNHAADALKNQAGLDNDGEANGALVAAAHAVQNALNTANKGESDQIRARVSEMLQWMSMNMAQGSGGPGEDFGQGVATRAREIAGEAEQICTQAQLQTQTQLQQQTQSQNGDQGQSGQAHQEQNGEGPRGSE